MTTTNSLLRIIPVAGVAALAGCTLDATNPGPIRSDLLENRAAISAMVNGAGRNFAEALNWVGYTSGAVAREIHPAGSTGAFGITVLQQSGKLPPDDGNTWWNFSQRARWTAEKAVSQGKEQFGTAAANNATIAQGLVWVGYANRLLGENFCDGVIDGGPKQPASVYFERAEAAFTEALTTAQAAATGATGAALTLAQTLQTASLAGRASVRLNRGNNAGAVADAALVTNNAFRYQVNYFQTELDLYNRIFWASANQPYRAHTVWNTWLDAYKKGTRADTRIAFDSSATQPVGDAAVGNLGRVRWLFQIKYNVLTAPITLSSGWEMRLVEAEVRLINNDIPGAMALLNARRTGLGIPALVATTAEEAWLALKRERGIELWLEARRLGDFRRWAAGNRPGNLPGLESMAGRDLCFSTPLSEIETNPNF